MKEFKLFIDEKISIWRRTYVIIDAETLDEAIDKCKDENYYVDNSEYLNWTEELQEPEEYATYEIYDIADSTNPIYSNYDR